MSIVIITTTMRTMSMSIAIITTTMSIAAAIIITTIMREAR